MAARSPGSFSLNAYGYLTQANITTTGGLTLPGTTQSIHDWDLLEHHPDRTAGRRYRFIRGL
jgi:hypothetical protein